MPGETYPFASDTVMLRAPEPSVASVVRCIAIVLYREANARGRGDTNLRALKGDARADGADSTAA